MAHTYDESTADEADGLIRHEYYPVIKKTFRKTGQSNSNMKFGLNDSDLKHIIEEISKFPQI